jgi:acetyl-CoA acetyltransferase
VAQKQRVAIVGVGYSTIGRRTGLSLDTLTAQSSVAAMQDAGVTPKDIDGVAVHSFPHQYVSATHTAAMLGIPDVAWYSGSVQRHMAMYGTKEEDFGAFAVAQREYALANPTETFFSDPLTIDDYMNSRYIAKPLHLLDCDYPVDSSSALIFTTEERARDLKQKPVFFDAWAGGTTQEADFNLVEDMTHSSPWMASKRLWSRTDLKPADVGVAGLYDGFTFIAMQWLEALGFCGEGESGPFVTEGNTRANGVIPTNTDGGACNVGRRHGANFFIEVTRQLRGTAGDRALPNKPTAGVVSNAVGGFAAAALLTAE